MVEPTTQSGYLLLREYACSCNADLAPSHVALPQGRKYSKPNSSQVAKQTERRNAVSCSLSYCDRLPRGTSTLHVQKHKINTQSTKTDINLSITSFIIQHILPLFFATVKP